MAKCDTLCASMLGEICADSIIVFGDGDDLIGKTSALS